MKNHLPKGSTFMVLFPTLSDTLHRSSIQVSLSLGALRFPSSLFPPSTQGKSLKNHILSNKIFRTHSKGFLHDLFRQQKHKHELISSFIYFMFIV